MPFGDEILSVYNASVDCGSQFLFFQPMIVHDSDILFNLDFGQLFLLYSKVTVHIFLFV